MSLDYGWAIQQADRPYHFLYAFVEDVVKKLGVHVQLNDFRGDLYLSDEEKLPWPNLPEKYWLIDAGHKTDFLCKFWGSFRHQAVVDELKDRIHFVQIGSAGDIHPPLKGVTNLVGETDLRQLMRVMYRASGVVTPVSMPMHMAAALPTTQGQGRGCVVIAGHREQAHWERLPGHAYLGASGRIPCTKLGGGCWKNKVVKVDQDDNLCLMPTVDEAGLPIPECLKRVTVDDVVRAVLSFEDCPSQA